MFQSRFSPIKILQISFMQRAILLMLCFMIGLTFNLFSQEPMDWVDSPANISRDLSGGSCYDQYLPISELQRGDTWILAVDDYDMRTTVYQTFEVEVKVEDVLFENDSVLYAISYLPSKKIHFASYNFSEFGATQVGPEESAYYRDEFEGIYGVIEWVVKSTNRVSKRQLFARNDLGENVILAERKMKQTGIRYGNGRGYSGPEFRLPLMTFPYVFMKDTCWGSTQDHWGEELPDSVEVKTSCDTSLVRFSKYWKEDSLVVELRTRTTFRADYNLINRLYWVEDKKWWVKHESYYGGPKIERQFGSFGMERPGKFLKVILKEERLSNRND